MTTRNRSLVSPVEAPWGRLGERCVSQARTRGRGKSFVTPELLICERPAEVAEVPYPAIGRATFRASSAIGTLVERTTRYTLLHLPRVAAYDSQEGIKNDPALAGYGTEAVREAIMGAMSTLPRCLFRSMTWDQGAEMAQHAQLRLDTGLAVYFCNPHSPWQRGTNEKINGLLRQYFPKGTDLSAHGLSGLEAVKWVLNARPRKNAGLENASRGIERVSSIIRHNPMYMTKMR